MQRFIYTFLLLALSLSSAFAQGKVSLSGFVTDAQTGEALINATLADTRNMVGVVTNNYGFYTLSADGRTLQITCSYVGYRSQTIAVTALRDTVIHFRLVKGVEIAEVVVTSERRKLYQAQPITGIVEMEASLVTKLPTLFGEADLARMV